MNKTQRVFKILSRRILKFRKVDKKRNNNCKLKIKWIQFSIGINFWLKGSKSSLCLNILLFKKKLKTAIITYFPILSGNWTIVLAFFTMTAYYFLVGSWESLCNVLYLLKNWPEICQEGTTFAYLTIFIEIY